MMYKIKRDKFYASRGSYSKIYQIKCSFCKTNITKYQKDGPGIIKRMYHDRMFDIECQDVSGKLNCPNCKAMIGVNYIYKPENRLAYRLFAGSISKSIIK